MSINVEFIARTDVFFFLLIATEPTTAIPAGHGALEKKLSQQGESF
jgi:hypothetical protein